MKARTATAALLAAAVAACPRHDPTGWTDPPADGAEVSCPVLRKRCVKTPETPSAVFEERTYYFCGPDERARFLADPKAFADP